MAPIILPLSSLSSPSLLCDLSNVEISQFERIYPGNFSVNFPLCYSNINDFKVKNYTNFYLTGLYMASDIFPVDTSPLKSTQILTSLRYHDSYLSIINIDITPYKNSGNIKESRKYLASIFTDQEETVFTIEFFPNNRCNIYYTDNKSNTKYYLVNDDSNDVFFIIENEISFDSDYINPADFTYMFSETFNNIILLKDTENGVFGLTKTGETLGLTSKSSIYTSNPFTISRNIYTYPKISLDTSFITYNIDNTINSDKSDFKLNNNFLLYKKYCEDTPNTSIIVLKNQLSNSDVFTNANNLLSGSNHKSYIDSFREYTSIFEDISQENSEELELNYIFNNQTYKIVSGDNPFTTPTNMFPFKKININDCKFVESGAFASISPQYSDRIYEISDNNTLSNNGQYLLCTWLYKNPSTGKSLWVDRYYYPDLIAKEEAMVENYYINSPSDNIIEKLINDNLNLKESATYDKFFDVKSNMVFSPSKKFIYHRITPLGNITLSGIPANICQQDLTYPTNFFKTINKNNKFTLSFKFPGDSTSWVVKSDRNDIPCGVTISKNKNTITVDYVLYDPTTETYIEYKYSGNIKPLKTNFIAMSVDGLTGIGYIFLNSEQVYSFNISPYKYVSKQLLYGDFFLIYNNTKTNMFMVIDNKLISDVIISSEFIPSDVVYMNSTLNNANNIDIIHITLPCGMRNNTDNIELLQLVCNNSSYKSNNINIILKNMHNLSPDTQIEMENYIRTTIGQVLPQNARINNIEFKNFK